MPSKMLKGALIAGALLLGASKAAPTPAAQDVMIKNFNFGPAALAVAVGTTVNWHNNDGEPHTVVSADGLFRSAALDTGESFSFKFTKAGTFKYVCTIHPRMVATVTVK